MYIAQRKEQFSIAYVHAVSSVAGYTIYKPGVDNDSIDLGIAARSSINTPSSPRVELQLKCTSEYEYWHNDYLHFPLKKRNYEDLRGDDFLVPRLLVVVCVPENLDDWLDQNDQRLLMRYCGYWLTLRTFPERPDVTTSVTVPVPRSNIFTVATLQQIMGQINRREPL